MGWLDQFEGQIVAIDTSPFIYLIEEHPRYPKLVQPVFSAIDGGRIRAVTSTITLAEVLVQPFRQDRAELAEQYRQIITNSEGLTCLPVTVEVAQETARLRTQFNLRTPDAIQHAVAVTAGAVAFFNNNISLPNIPAITSIILDRL